MKIKAVGFDFGGVIEGQPGSFFQQRASDFLGVTKNQFTEAYFHHNELRNTNQISREELWQRVLNELGILEKLDGFLEQVVRIKNKSINTEVLEIVDSLRAHGYKVGILSNNVPEARDAFEKKGILEHFDAVLISGEIGHSKPHPKAFELLFEELGCKPDECVFVDDTKESLASAPEVGFHPILFVSANQLKKDLINLGILL